MSIDRDEFDELVREIRSLKELSQQGGRDALSGTNRAAIILGALGIVVALGLTAATLFAQINIEYANTLAEKVGSLSQKLPSIDSQINETRNRMLSLSSDISATSDEYTKFSKAITSLTNAKRSELDAQFEKISSNISYLDEKAKNAIEDSKKKYITDIDDEARLKRQVFASWMKEYEEASRSDFSNSLKTNLNKYSAEAEAVSHKTKIELLEVSSALKKLEAARTDISNMQNTINLHAASYRDNINRHIEDRVSRYIKDQHQMMLSLVGTAISQSLRSESQGETGIDDQLLVGRPSDEIMNAEDVRLEMLPPGTQICGDSRHEAFFTQLRGQAGQDIRYNKKKFVLAVDRVAATQQDSDGSKCDFAFGTLGDAARGNGIKKLFEPPLKTRFIRTSQ